MKRLMKTTKGGENEEDVGEEDGLLEADGKPPPAPNELLLLRLLLGSLYLFRPMVALGMAKVVAVVKKLLQSGPDKLATRGSIYSPLIKLLGVATRPQRIEPFGRFH
ncbi:unnamed protein product [Caenorhabditis auriculariae]|uniref:Uncharacterized protein n=1 Tax=Caenorhabditis auriculariae TaxID=2777116 RepID=A0A8S1GMK9_9PELO|nr:unnamed protein product [Caenorhabditis auriculariae]